MGKTIIIKFKVEIISFFKSFIIYSLLHFKNIALCSKKSFIETISPFFLSISTLLYYIIKNIRCKRTSLCFYAACCIDKIYCSALKRWSFNSLFSFSKLEIVWAILPYCSRMKFYARAKYCSNCPILAN